MSLLVLDNTVLSHFARAEQLAALADLTAAHHCTTAGEVIRELVAGIGDHPTLAKVIGLAWLEVVELIDVQEIVEFARYKSEFGGGPDRNNGEAAVLAWALTNGAVAIVDE